MSKKEEFRLSDETRKKINDEYYAPEGRRVMRIHAQPVTPKVGYHRTQQWENGGYSAYKPQDEEYEPPKKKHRLRKLMVFTAIFCVIVILLNIAFFFFRGQIWFNEPRKRDYPVRGAAIDSTLGTIDWETMSQQTISYVYIRASKGKVSVDEQFKANRKGAKKTDLLLGYYHEFDFSADGEKQAENFIEQIGSLDGRLVPMVKVEKYGIYYLQMKNADEVKKNLQDFLDKIEEEYGVSCIIMCDSACYKKYIEPYFSDYPLWTVNHFGKPDKDLDWTMWEFNPRVRTEGYSNSKKYFSMSVYKKSKSLEDFKANFLI